jgi:hypothetical protein
MIVSIHQPNHLPYLGFFEKMAKSDIFILYDNTQFARYDIGFQNRNRIRTKDGWIWLTVPIKHEFGANINEIKIDNSKKWARKNWTSIMANYSKAKYFKEYKQPFEEIFSKTWETLADLNIAIIKKAAELLGIKTKILAASELIDLKTKSTDALVDLCKAAKATVYLSGRDGKEYLEHEKFDKEKIKVIYQDYKHPTYTQAYEGFKPYMCFLDLLFNQGPDSLKILINEKGK